MIPRKRRRACERCHSQKLRCPPVESARNVCGRCAKAGVPCVFENKIYPTQQPTAIAAGAESPNDLFSASTPITCSIFEPTFATPQFVPGNLLFDNQFSGFDDGTNFGTQDDNFTSGLFLDPERSSTKFFTSPIINDEKVSDEDLFLNNHKVPVDIDGKSNDHELLESYAEVNYPKEDSDTQEHSSSEYLNQAVSPRMSLEDLISSLNAMHTSIPPLTIYNKSGTSLGNNQKDDEKRGTSVSEITTVVDTSSYTRNGCKPYVSMDKVLKLTEAVIKALQETFASQDQDQNCQGTPGSAPQEQSIPVNQSSTQILTSSPGHDSKQSGSVDPRSTRNIDRASAFLLLSCLHRCVDIWNLFFGHIEQMIDKGRFPTNENGGVSPCKPVMVGSYTPSSTPLSVSLLFMTIRGLLSELHQSCEALLARSLNPYTQTSTNSSRLSALPENLHHLGSKQQTDNEKSCPSGLHSQEIQLAFKNATLMAGDTQDHLHAIVKHLSEAGKIPRGL